AGVGVGRRGESSDEPVGSGGQSHTGVDGWLLYWAATRRGAERGIAEYAITDAQKRRAPPSLLLGRVHPIRRMGKPGRQTVEFNFYPPAVLTADSLHGSRQEALRILLYWVRGGRINRRQIPNQITYSSLANLEVFFVQHISACVTNANHSHLRQQAILLTPIVIK